MHKEICVLVSPVAFLWVNKGLTFWIINEWPPEIAFTSYMRQTEAPQLSCIQIQDWIPSTTQHDVFQSNRLPVIKIQVHYWT